MTPSNVQPKQKVNNLQQRTGNHFISYQEMSGVQQRHSLYSCLLLAGLLQLYATAQDSIFPVNFNSLEEE